MNISDIIESFINERISGEGGYTEIRRNELAERLGCVPSQINYVIDRVDWLYQNRKLIGGLKFVYEPPVLRFFMGGLEPKTNWPARLLEKFRKDFGDSL